MRTLELMWQALMKLKKKKSNASVICMRNKFLPIATCFLTIKGVLQIAIIYFDVILIINSTLSNFVATYYINSLLHR